MAAQPESARGAARTGRHAGRVAAAGRAAGSASPDGSQPRAGPRRDDDGLRFRADLFFEHAAGGIERGYDGLIVSNHGGRSMDYGPSTLEVLPEIVDAVGGRIAVPIDSGFRRGSDVVKAIALGADAVCLGRAPRWGLGAFGPPGVQRLLEIVKTEFRQAMARTGRTTLAALDRTVLKTDFR